MTRYYTRACNFYYGNKSKFLVKKKKAIPLNGNNQISFDHIEIISRTSKKKIPINKINSLAKSQKKLIKLDLAKISSKKKNFSFGTLKYFAFCEICKFDDPAGLLSETRK